MSALGRNAEKRFYEQNILVHEPLDSERVSVDQRTIELLTPGDRYYCITDFLKDGKALAAIEWGFGDTARCAALSRVFGSYIAIDICASTLVGRANLDRKYCFLYRDANLNDDLPFADESFDVSIAMMVIEHLFDPFHSFFEIARTTRRGGYVFVNLPLISSFKSRFAVLFGRVLATSVRNWWSLRQWDGGHLHYFNISSVRRLAAENSLRFRRFYPVGKFLEVKRLAPSLLCHEGSFVFQKV
jgi:hypothetical protein